MCAHPRSGANWQMRASRRSDTALVLFGNNQRLDMYSWQPQTASVMCSVPFAWKPDTWYHLKLRVENTADGKTRVLGKAWPTAGSEPAAWMIDQVSTRSPTGKGVRDCLSMPTSGALYRQHSKVTAN